MNLFKNPCVRSLTGGDTLLKIEGTTMDTNMSSGNKLYQRGNEKTEGSGGD